MALPPAPDTSPDTTPPARRRWLPRWRADASEVELWAVRIGVALVLAGWVAVLVSAVL
jgi:hypothetical protein